MGDSPIVKYPSSCLYREAIERWRGGIPDEVRYLSPNITLEIFQHTQVLQDNFAWAPALRTFGYTLFQWPAWIVRFVRKMILQCDSESDANVPYIFDRKAQRSHKFRWADFGFEVSSLIFISWFPMEGQYEVVGPLLILSWRTQKQCDILPQYTFTSREKSLKSPQPSSEQALNRHLYEAVSHRPKRIHIGKKIYH